MKVNVFPGIREQLKNQYIKRIVVGELQPGDRIEAVRVIAEKAGVSHVTASSVLKELVNDGWVESHVGRGSFVAKNPPIDSYHGEQKQAMPGVQLPGGNKTNIYFIFCFSEAASSASYHYQILNAMQAELKNADWKVIPYVLTDNDDMNQIKTDRQTLGIVMSNPFPKIKDTVYKQLNELKLPIVQYGMHPELLQCNYVMPDNYAMGILAGEYLLKNKHQYIQLITAWNESDQNTSFFYKEGHFKLRFEGVKDVYARAGFPVNTPLTWHIEKAECRQAIGDLLNKVKNNEDDRPTALVVGNQVMAAELLYLAEMMQVKVPDDLSIITFEKRVLKDQDDDFLTTVDFSKEAMGSMIIQQLACSLSNPKLGPVKYTLPVSLLEGKSVKRL